MGTALALDLCSKKPVDTANFECASLMMTEPADTVGSAVGVLKGEGTGN